MVEKQKITTNKDRDIEAKCYGEERFQTEKRGDNEKLTITANDYGFNSIQWIIDEIQKAQKNGEDRIIVLAGEVRVGKSNLASHLATRLGMSNAEKVRYDGKEYLRQLQNADIGEVTWLDEGGRGMYYKNWMKKENKLINQMFQQIGAKNLVSIICLPHKELLDKELRQMRVHYWGQVKFQGYRRGFVKWRISGKRKRSKDEIKVPRHENEWSINVYWEPLFKMRFPKFRENNGFTWEDYEDNKMDRLHEFGEEALDESEKNNITKNKLENEKKKVKAKTLLKETDLTQEGIGDKVDLSRSRVADIKSEMDVNA